MLCNLWLSAEGWRVQLERQSAGPRARLVLLGLRAHRHSRCASACGGSIHNSRLFHPNGLLCLGGILSERYGGKYFYGIGIGATALFTVLTPVATRWLDLAGILSVRFLEGLLEVRRTPLAKYCNSIPPSTSLSGKRVGSCHLRDYCCSICILATQQ